MADTDNHVIRASTRSAPRRSWPAPAPRATRAMAASRSPPRSRSPTTWRRSPAAASSSPTTTTTSCARSTRWARSRPWPAGRLRREAFRPRREARGPAGSCPVRGGFLVVSEDDHVVRGCPRAAPSRPSPAPGRPGFADDLADPLLAEFDSPLGIAATNPGYDALLADTKNHRIRAITFEQAPPGGGTGRYAPAAGETRPRTARALPPPVLGKAVAVAPAKGTVRIRRRGSKRFETLTERRSHPRRLHHRHPPRADRAVERARPQRQGRRPRTSGAASSRSASRARAGA